MKSVVLALWVAVLILIPFAFSIEIGGKGSTMAIGLVHGSFKITTVGIGGPTTAPWSIGVPNLVDLLPGVFIEPTMGIWSFWMPIWPIPLVLSFFILPSLLRQVPKSLEKIGEAGSERPGPDDRGTSSSDY